MNGGEGDYHKCTKCPRMYASEDLLEKHMQRKHSTDEVTTPIPREASNFGGVIQSTLQRRRDKTRQGGGVSASRANTFHPTAPTGSAESGSRGMPTLHEDTAVKVELPAKKKGEKKSKQKKGKRKFKAGDIGAPKNFIHVTGMKLGSEGMQMVDNST